MHSTIDSTVQYRTLRTVLSSVYAQPQLQIYMAQPGFEPGTSRFQAPIDSHTNEPSRPATLI